MLVFVTYVFGNYYKYIPYYILGINHAYPECHIKIYTDRPLTQDEKGMLSAMQSYELEVFDIRLPENYILGGNGRAYRWLIPYKELRDYEYAYIGDVDMMIVREEPTLLEAHKDHMRKTGLPFSNCIRPEGRRMSGLHFIDVKAYYEKMEPVIQGYLKDKDKLCKALAKCQRNEHFLYNIVKEGIGFNGVEQKITEGKELHYRPHHGLHIGLLREKKERFIEMIPDYISSYAFKSLFERAPLPELETLIK